MRDISVVIREVVTVTVDQAVRLMFLLAVGSVRMIVLMTKGAVSVGTGVTGVLPYWIVRELVYCSLT